MQWIEFAVNREYLLGILYMLVMIMNVNVEMLFDCFCYWVTRIVQENSCRTGFVVVVVVVSIGN